MKNRVVKLITDDDGIDYTNDFWHLIDPCNSGGPATLCTAEYFGMGESACKYETKLGKITCPDCIDKIKTYKSIRL